jgi:hypothetical protein
MEGAKLSNFSSGATTALGERRGWPSSSERYVIDLSGVTKSHDAPEKLWGLWNDKV